jgi:hypothetical protein
MVRRLVTKYTWRTASSFLLAQSIYVKSTTMPEPPVDVEIIPRRRVRCRPTNSLANAVLQTILVKASIIKVFARTPIVFERRQGLRLT